MYSPINFKSKQLRKDKNKSKKNPTNIIENRKKEVNTKK